MTVFTPVELPDNLPACHAIIRRQAEVIEELFARIDRLNRDLAAVKRNCSVRVGNVSWAAAEKIRRENKRRSSKACSQTELPAEESQAQAAASAPPRTSKGRQRRVIDASIPREKVLHPLDEREVPAELWNHPRAKRFFRFVREEVELQETPRAGLGTL